MGISDPLRKRCLLLEVPEETDCTEDYRCGDKDQHDNEQPVRAGDGAGDSTLRCVEGTMNCRSGLQNP